MNAEATVAKVPDARHGWKVLAIVSAGVFMAALDVTIVNIAFPAIAEDFAPASLASLSWILNAYAIVFAALLVPAGRIADRVGRKRSFLAGLGVFVVASGLSAASTSPEMLVAFRVVQAVGAAFLVPTSLALLLPEFPASKRAVAVGIWGAAGGVAAALGPSLGGLLVEASWRWVFLVNVPFGLMAAYAGARVLTEAREPAGSRRPDMLGALLLALGVGALALGIVKGPEWGWGSERELASFAAAALLLVAFFVRSARHPAPVVELSLFRIRSFSAASSASLAFSVAFFAMLLMTVLFLTQVWGYSTLKAGLAISPGPLMAAVFSVIAGRLAQHYGQRPIATIGALVFAAGGLYWIANLGTTPHYVTDFLPGMMIGGIGVGLSISTQASAATMSLPPARFATGSAIFNMSRQLGAVLGISVLVAILGNVSPTDPLHAFHAAWDFMLASALVSAVAASLIRPAGERTRESAVAPAVQGAGMSGAQPAPQGSADRYAVVDWTDPHQIAQRLATMPGVDGLRAVADGTLPPPPIASLLGMEIIEVDVGRVVFALVPSEQHYNPIGLIHGGIAATLIDSATGCAVHSLLPAGAGYATVDLNVNYDRPITLETGRITCEATIVNRGKRIVTAEAKVVADATGKLLAHGQTTCMLIGG